MKLKSQITYLLATALISPIIAIAAVAPTPKTVLIPEEEAVITTYQQAIPSVVNIVISEEIRNMVGGVSKQDTGGGTGFFVSTDGYIITNKHVVAREDVEYTAVTSDGREFAASVLARDPFFDIAIVKVEGAGFKPARLGDSDKVRIGQSVIAIGNVLAEFRNTVTRGIVSGISRTITASGGGKTETIEGAIQTDASINPGNSGGPLLNLKGEVIGINTAINRAGESLGFSIPINRAKQALEKFRKYGEIKRAFLGVRYLMLNRSIARAYALPITQGAYILIKDSEGNAGVLPDTPAAKAGLKPGDVVLSVNGETLTIQKSLSTLISQFDPGKTVEVKILRDGAEQTISVTLDGLAGEKK